MDCHFSELIDGHFPKVTHGREEDAWWTLGGWEAYSQGRKEKLIKRLSRYRIKRRTVIFSKFCGMKISPFYV